jgi:hypothetical protein
MATKLPFQIREAIVQVCGKAFWYRDPFRAFLLAAGVPSDLYDRFADEPKYKLARHILGELDTLGDEGFMIQRRIVTELCKLRNIPDEAAPDRQAALQAIRWLRELATDQKLIVEVEKTGADLKVQEARRRQAALAARAQKMAELRAAYNAMVVSRDDPQKRGYGLEDLLAELFETHEIAYRRPYRTGTEQIDGHFEFKGFDYLVEARWRSEPPSEADLAGFKTKVDKKLTSTRGFFLSIIGFRPEVVTEFTKGLSSNIVLMDGADLSLILEGHVSLWDALDMKIQKAAQEGIIYFPLAERFNRA